MTPRLALLLALSALAVRPALPQPSAPAALPETTLLRRSTRAVDRIPEVSADRVRRLAENPDGLSVGELNASLPELDAIEIDNSIASGNGGDADRDLVVVAWNIERGRHWRGAAALVRAHPALRDADVLLLSEMDDGMARSGNEHTTRELALALGMNYAFGVEFLELTGGEPEERGAGENARGFHGNAILTNRFLRKPRLTRFPGVERWYGQADSGQRRLGGRMALAAEIEVAGRPVLFVSTHLESGLAAGAARERETRLVLDELRATGGDGPIVLGGDLNAPPSSRPLGMLREFGFEVDPFNDPAKPTLQRVREGRVELYGPRIDYVVARGFDPVAGEPPVVVPSIDPRDGSSLGDHAAVVARLRLR